MTIDDKCTEDFDRERQEETSRPGTYYVIGGQNYEPELGERCHKPPLIDPCKAIEDVKLYAQDYKDEGHLFARVWQVTVDKHRTIEEYKLFHERELEPEDL